MVLAGLAWGRMEQVNHGPHVPHQRPDGQHNEDFDHEAILGSEALDEEFAGLDPEEARRRLLELAKKHDKDGDGSISMEEMYDWMVYSFQSLDQEEAIERMEEEDADENGHVSEMEYLEKNFGFTPSDIAGIREAIGGLKEGKNEEQQEQIRTLKLIDEDLRRFRGADLDGDGVLNKEEYIAFFFPYNFGHMHGFELELYLSENDKDGDGKISREEFRKDPSNDHEARITADENFKEFDKNKDGVLTLDELKDWVIPNMDEQAMEEAQHLIEMADENKDGVLSMEEIGEKTHDFVGSTVTDYGNILKHEEL